MSYFPDYSHDLSAPNEAQFVVTNKDVKKHSTWLPIDQRFPGLHTSRQNRV